MDQEAINRQSDKAGRWRGWDRGPEIIAVFSKEYAKHTVGHANARDAEGLGDTFSSIGKGSMEEGFSLPSKPGLRGVGKKKDGRVGTI